MAADGVHGRYCVPKGPSYAGIRYDDAGDATRKAPARPRPPKRARKLRAVALRDDDFGWMFGASGRVVSPEAMALAYDLQARLNEAGDR